MTAGPAARTALVTDGWHAVVRRSAPALAAWATLMLLELYVLVASGDRDIDISASPTVADWSVLVVLALLLPLMAAVAFAVSRIPNPRVRTAIAWGSIVAGLASDTYETAGWAVVRTEVVDIVVILLILTATGTGLGAILGWALRTTFTHLRSAGQLLARALPVVLLTLLVFFNNTVWYIAANLETGRIWLLVAGMAAIALAFTVTESVHACRPLLADAEPPRRRSERVKVVAVVSLAQSIQALVLALVTGVIFFAMGLIVLNAAVLDHLTDGNPASTHWLDIALPVDQALAHITAILIAMTFMYLSARAATDAKHRAEFVDPLLDDLRATLAVHGPADQRRYPL
ncbi:hypothetical protein FK535_00935 [Mycolicibacterium sp. 018/SC-01/001]|uniref:hypothetical protein n=1 Tax=Mycolicibacterium sp. 018/SC-01/001 TaxID=2592069 RepID=UPI00117FE027|nr:hypothetical protein [Mycolicibacterium sp. 018/SC-01/001]TRW88874.1 hypothetical protein FK535_00935 [Mycolicibacterium sp. 018/SC-01/001]